MSDLTAEMLRGSSGAVVAVHATHVTKTAQDPEVRRRVVAQASWLEQHSNSALPIMLDLTAGGYVMEKLDEIPPYTLQVADLDAIVGRLARGVWVHPPKMPLVATAHYDKVRPLEERYASDEMRRFLQIRREIALTGSQRACLTHGDPTLDNVMTRMGFYVIADPIPATPAVPDLWAVDLGKILQSLVGFEQVRYGRSPHIPLEVRPTHLLDTLHEPADQVRAVYWCVVHILRAMPYVSDTIHDKLRECAHRAISLV